MGSLLLQKESIQNLDYFVSITFHKNNSEKLVFYQMGLVIAPSAADVTSEAYFARAPVS